MAPFIIRRACSNRRSSSLISTLRKTHGESFAKGESPNAKLSEVLQRLDEPSLSKLIKDVHG
jgi:hypothetical protein